MKKMIVIIMLITLAGCGVTTTENEIWENINHQEYSADNGWAGIGIYFFEEDNIKYCDFMIYGSGLPVISISRSTVEFGENDTIILTFLDGFMPLELTTETSETTQTSQITLVYTDDVITWKSYTFIDLNWDQHEECFDFGYCDNLITNH